MTDDILSRLRGSVMRDYGMSGLGDEAAAEIERLTPYVAAFRREEDRADKAERDLDDARAKIARLRATLKPFAIYAAGIAKDHPGWDHDNFDFQLPDYGPTMREFRAARAAVEGADQ